MPHATKHAGPLCLSALTFLLLWPAALSADTVINSYDNTGKTFLVDSTSGNVILENGPFTGGTISTRDGFHFRSHYGTLTGVTLDGQLVSAYGTQARNLTLSPGS